jgi:predicted RNA binding protein YcfA (HicA-like mRNA interferase family)
LPAVSGNQLIRLLKKDGWQIGRRANHGRTMTKLVGSRILVTFIPEKSDSLPKGTLSDILGSKQTRIKKEGLASLITKYGL